jgi:hypothetical protein
MCTSFWTINPIISKMYLLNSFIFFTLEKDVFIN